MLFDYLVFALSDKDKSQILNIDLLQIFFRRVQANLQRQFTRICQFKVNGRLHKGTVIIALNSADYYEVYLQSGEETILINGEVCFDELGDVIDEHIERGKDREEYSQFCRQQLSEFVEHTML